VKVRSASQVANPDDPDGDQSEAIMWMDPADLPGNPMVRAELAASLADVLPLLGTGSCDCCGGSGEHATGHECYRCDSSGSVTTAEAAEPFCDEAFRDPDAHAQGCPNCGAAPVAKAADAGPKAPALSRGPAGT
jgi:hypothetical protein